MLGNGEGREQRLGTPVLVGKGKVGGGGRGYTVLAGRGG